MSEYPSIFFKSDCLQNGITGTTAEVRSFSVNLIQGGMWIIDASFTQVDSKTLIAEDSRKFYKVGDVLEYKTIQVKTELTIWVQ